MYRKSIHEYSKLGGGGSDRNMEDNRVSIGGYNIHLVDYLYTGRGGV